MDRGIPRRGVVAFDEGNQDRAGVRVPDLPGDLDEPVALRNIRRGLDGAQDGRQRDAAPPDVDG